MTPLPQRIRDYFTVRLFPTKPLFMQVATQSHDRPHVRTMRLYGFTGTGELVFITHAQTQKCDDIKYCSNVAVMIYDEQTQIQIRATGKACMVKLNAIDDGIIFWNQIAENVKKIYVLSEETTGNIPNSCLAIKIAPDSWEYLKLNMHEYLLSEFYQYHAQSNWAEEQGSVQP